MSLNKCYLLEVCCCDIRGTMKGQCSLSTFKTYGTRVQCFTLTEHPVLQLTCKRPYGRTDCQRTGDQTLMLNLIKCMERITYF